MATSVGKGTLLGKKGPCLPSCPAVIAVLAGDALRDDALRDDALRGQQRLPDLHPGAAVDALTQGEAFAREHDEGRSVLKPAHLLAFGQIRVTADHLRS